jgi:hypothetical protein
MKDAENSERTLNKNPGPNAIDDLISQGEMLVRNWTPKA